ncbi:uncharacterized protein LOC114527571 [Dendronephthya gigantea]|uniref:uncharacterized protein LOC114527571 n=1 Tax=Dendronephthya gigantea TaxID=151771 RepID=UPI00106AC014|nr:uncharacterized protein LOC114527571 [Dendronephthya gigantea]
MAGRFEINTPSPSSSTPSPSSSGFHWPLLWNSPTPAGQFLRSVSDQQGQATPTTSRQLSYQMNSNWRVALRCKQHVGTQEWINCKHNSCVHLRDELHHLLECPCRIIGGCKTRCHVLREELKKIREQTTKHPTIPDEDRRIPGSNKLQVKLQVLTIVDYVENCTYSPTSPAVDEPFQSPAERSEDASDTAIELIPLDQNQLSVTNGHFRKGTEWEKIHFLGKGTFGSTYLCFDRIRSFHFAIKKLQVSKFHEEEIKIWQKLSGKHPNILELYGAVQRRQRILIFMEYMNGGSVGDFLARHGALSERNALKILKQVLSGLNFMHRNRIVHGDIKAANVLMNEFGLQVKIADFGSCIDLNSMENSRPLAGTLAFMAPEVCRSEAPAASADIWSAMCLLIQLLTAEAPWEEYRHQSDNLLFVIGSAKRPPRLPKCSEDVQEIFSKGLNVTANLRPTAAEFLRYRVFNFAEEDLEVQGNSDEGNSRDNGDSRDGGNSRDNGNGEEGAGDSDDSSDYQSSGELETSSEYYSSIEDELDRAGPSLLRRARCTRTRDRRHIDKTGGALKIPNAHVTFPVNALTKDTRVSITTMDPGQFYQTIIDNDIQDKVTILGNVFKLHPSGLKFCKNVSVKVTLPEALHQSEELRVLHGTFDETRNKLLWVDIEKSTRVVPFEDSAVVTVDINHFSLLMFVKSVPSFAYEYVTTYLNFRPSFFRFRVVVRRQEQRLEVCVVLVSESFFSNMTCDADLFKDRSISHKMKGEGFCEMYGSRKEYLSPKESIEVKVEGLMEIGSCQTKRYTVRNVFGGEVVASWELDAGEDEDQPISGTVQFKRAAGQSYRFQFWQHDPTRYVQEKLKLDSLIYNNILSLGRALSLSQEELDGLVETTGGDEEKQLQKITETWTTKAENNELPRFKDFIASSNREAILVSDRGKSHLRDISEFREKWRSQMASENEPLGKDLLIKTMAESAANLCQSVFSDCVLQSDHSEETIRLVSDEKKLKTVMEKVLETVQQKYSQSVATELSSLRDATVSYEGDRTNSQLCERFSQNLSDVAPWLMQIVKDYFKMHPITEPTGLWGLHSEAEQPEINQQGKCASKIWYDLCKLLKELCQANSSNDDTSQLEIFARKLNVEELIERLVRLVTHKEWLSIAARIRYYCHFADKMMGQKLSRSHTRDLENVFDCFRKYVSFCPTRLVQFSFSNGKVKKEPLSFDQDSIIFTQKCSVSLEENTTELSMKVEVHIRGVKLFRELSVPFQQCPERDETHGECASLTVVYQHHSEDEGLLKVTNDCQQLNEEHRVQTRAESLQVSDEPDAGSSTSNIQIKEDCPEESELNEIAEEVANDWEKIGRKLLSNKEVTIVDHDEDGVVEKATRILEKWKQSKGSGATYRLLYEALVDQTVNRRDIAEHYCVVPGSRRRNTEL